MPVNGLSNRSQVDASFMWKILAVMIFATVSCGTTAVSLAVKVMQESPTFAVVTGEKSAADDKLAAADNQAIR